MLKTQKGTFFFGRKTLYCYLAGYPVGYRISGQISIRRNPSIFTVLYGLLEWLLKKIVSHKKLRNIKFPYFIFRSFVTVLSTFYRSATPIQKLFYKQTMICRELYFIRNLHNFPSLNVVSVIFIIFTKNTFWEISIKAWVM